MWQKSLCICGDQWWIGIVDEISLNEGDIYVKLLEAVHQKHYNGWHMKINVGFL